MRPTEARSACYRGAGALFVLFALRECLLRAGREAIPAADFVAMCAAGLATALFFAGLISRGWSCTNRAALSASHLVRILRRMVFLILIGASLLRLSSRIGGTRL
jgi:hypothetical protein